VFNTFSLLTEFTQQGNNHIDVMGIPVGRKGLFTTSEDGIRIMDCENLTKDDTAKSTEASKMQRKNIDVTPERDKGVLKEIQRQGTGDEHPLKGDTVYLHYVGRLQDGTEFDCSRKGSEKFQLLLDSNDGMSAVIAYVFYSIKTKQFIPS